jgi:molybdopterin synthase sulfur carrier subunit
MQDLDAVNGLHRQATSATGQGASWSRMAPMRIKVRGYLTLKDVIGDQPFREIESERITVEELINQLWSELGDSFARMSPNPGAARESSHLIALVNGRHCSHLPDGLATELKDGDEISIFPPVAGG